MSRDRLFLYVVLAFMIVLLLYGGGTVYIIVADDSPGLSGKMLSAFSAMFSGTLGLCAGYLLGKRDDDKGDKSE